MLGSDCDFATQESYTLAAMPPRPLWPIGSSQIYHLRGRARNFQEALSFSSQMHAFHLTSGAFLLRAQLKSAMK